MSRTFVAIRGVLDEGEATVGRCAELFPYPGASICHQGPAMILLFPSVLVFVFVLK